MNLWKTTCVILIGILAGALSFGPAAEANMPISSGHSFSMNMDRNGAICYFGMASIRKPACQCPEGYTWVGWKKVRLTKEDGLEAICLRR